MTNIPRRQQHFEIWLRPVPPASAGFAIRQAIYETAEAHPRRHSRRRASRPPAQFLRNYLNLWAQDGSRRLGYAIDAEIYGKDIIAELKARLPRMTKADVDRAVRSICRRRTWPSPWWATRSKTSPPRSSAGRPTPIVYDTKDTPAEVLAEDKIIEKHPLPISASAIKIVSAKTMFEK